MDLTDPFKFSRSLPRVVVFREVVRCNGFSGAARALSVTPASVSRMMAALERQINVRLFHRTTRRFSLTPEGQAFYSRLHKSLDDLEYSINSAREMISPQETPSGNLKISLPSSYGTFFVIPRLHGFLKKYPEVVLDVSFNDAPFDLIDEDVEVAVCYGRPTAAEYVSRVICRPEIRMAARPAYLASVGGVEAPRDLRKCRFLAARGNGPGDQSWVMRPKSGAGPEICEFHSVMTFDSTEGVVMGAANGLGVTAAASYALENFVRAGLLVELLNDFSIVYDRQPPVISVVYANRKNVALRVRAFVDFLAGLSSQPAE